MYYDNLVHNFCPCPLQFCQNNYQDCLKIILVYCNSSAWQYPTYFLQWQHPTYFLQPTIRNSIDTP